MTRLRHPSLRDLMRAADKELPAADTVRLETHLAKCAECNAVVASTRALGMLARTLPSPVGPKDLVHRALARRRRDERTLIPRTGPNGEARGLS